MQTSTTRIHDPARARAYFEEKLAFTTGPVELDRWIKAGEDNLVVVDVRTAGTGRGADADREHEHRPCSPVPDPVPPEPPHAT